MNIYMYIYIYVYMYIYIYMYLYVSIHIFIRPFPFVSSDDVITDNASSLPRGRGARQSVVPSDPELD